jgi:hypothetical protein
MIAIPAKAVRGRALTNAVTNARQQCAGVTVIGGRPEGKAAQCWRKASAPQTYSTKEEITVDTVSIAGIDKAVLLHTLWAHSCQQGMGFLQKNEFSLEDAREAVKNETYFDYVQGRVVKCDIGTDEMETRLYDRDLGQGAAARAVEAARTLCK